MSVVGCSPTTWLQPRAPQELKVECSALDASVPPTGVKTIRIYPARPPDKLVPAMATHTHNHASAELVPESGRQHRQRKPGLWSSRTFPREHGIRGQDVGSPPDFFCSGAN